MGNFSLHPPPSVVTPGNHDGVHAGHRALIQEARRVAGAASPGLRVLALTFHPHPMELVAKDRAPALLTTPERRAELLRGAGADEVVVQPFDAAFAALSPEDFVGRVLCEQLGARAVVVGDDFRFGRGRAGDVQALAALCAQRGVQVVSVPKVMVGNEVVSSSRVRSFISQGDVASAAAMLTRIHDVARPVVHGQKRGRTIGVPTANLALDGVLVPADGVYAVAVRVLDGSPELRTPGPLFGVANLGVRPTLEAGRALEVHIHDFDGDLYGRTLRVGFIARLREERRFPDLAALRTQITEDIVASRQAAAACDGELLSWI